MESTEGVAVETEMGKSLRLASKRGRELPDGLKAEPRRLPDCAMGCSLLARRRGSSSEDASFESIWHAHCQVV